MSALLSKLTSHQFYLLFSVLGVFVSICLAGIIYFSRKVLTHHSHSLYAIVPKFFYANAKKPLALVLLLYTGYGVALAIASFKVIIITDTVFYFTQYIVNLFTIALLFWAILNILISLKAYLLKLSLSSNHQLISFILPVVNDSFFAAIILMMCNIVVSQMNFVGVIHATLDKTLKILLITTIGWIFVQTLNALENYILISYTPHDNINAARKLKSHVTLLKRILLIIGAVITLASLAMLFDNIREYGQGLFATAGIISAVTVFASQKSLGALFSGLQLAFTLPIRVGDEVIIDDEFGEVEEINLSYVVIKLWNLKRLIKPIDYFITNGFQNLSRETTQLLGEIFIYADYALPIEPVRAEFFNLLNDSEYWDKNTKSLDVTDITDKSIEIRALMSAASASMLWKLRCEIREKLIKFLVETYPNCFAKSRSMDAKLTQFESVATSS